VLWQGAFCNGISAHFPPGQSANSSSVSACVTTQQVVEGLEIVSKIADVECDAEEDEKPKAAIVISDCGVVTE